MKKYMTIKNAVLAVAGIVLVYSLLGFLALPFAGKKIITNRLQVLPGVIGGVGKLRFNPFTLEAGLEALEINDSAGNPVFRLKGLHVNLSSVSLFKLAPVITRLDLDTPEVFLVLNRENRLNIDALFAGAGSKPHDGKDEKASDPGESTGNKVFPFRLSNAAIHDGRFSFSDEIRNKEQVVDGINLALPLLTSLEGERETQAEPVIRLGINGAPVEIRLASLPFNPALDTKIVLSATGIDLTAAVPYLNLPKTLEILSPGKLDLALTGSYRLDPARKGRPHILGADLRIALRKLDIRTKENDTGGTSPLFSCPEFIVQAASKDILAGTAVIDKLEFNTPRLNLERDGEGRLTLMNLFPVPGGEEAPPVPADQDSAAPSQPRPFHITLVRGGVNNGEINFNDDSVSPVFKTALSRLNIHFKKMEIGPKGVISGDYDAGFATEENEQVSIQGALATTPALSVKGRLDLKEILPEKYRPYYAPYGGKGLTLGKIKGGAGFNLFIDGNTPVFSVDDGGINLSDIRIQGETDTAPVVDIKAVDCSGISIGSEHRRIRIETIIADSGRLDLVRNRAGDINLVQRISEMVPVPVKGEEGVGGADAGNETKADSEGQPASPWEISIGRFNLENYGLVFSDHSPGDPVRLEADEIGITAEELTTIQDKKGKIHGSLTLQKQGRFSLDGELALSPPAAVMDLNLEKIAIDPFQPYFADKLNIAVAKGSVGAKGRLWLSLPQTGGPDIRFKGEGGLIDFISQTKNDGNDFFRCKSLYLSGMDMDLSPMAVNIKKIALTDFYQKTVISESGTLNLGTIVKSSAQTQPPGASSTGENGKKYFENTAASPIINIDAVTLQGGHINFTDQHTPPGFTANMTEVGGSVTGLSSLPDRKPAQLLLKGTHGRQAPLDISGMIDPLKKEPYADLAISFKNIELPQFNAYTKKYLGYPIEKGKLILDLKYNIKGDRLKSSNHIFFDQLTLGKSVDSPDAISLPLELAISLLKNSKNEIKLDVPIQGNLSDPKFSYGDVVATTLKNLILGVVTAPFKFLGSLVGLGDDQDLGHVAFAPGSDTLDPEELGKIGQLTGILAEKDRLKLEIQGKYSLEKDGDRLREIKYRSLLEATQAEAGVAAEKEIDQLTAEERLELVDAAYARAQFPKPRDESGKEKELSPGEKQKLLITAISVGENELKELATRRSELVRDHMVQGGIDPLRIFIKEPGPAAEEESQEEAVKTLFELK
ncbi:MAG: DUF748 domain-containing protein [Desulfobacter sp.]|nr:MAG: DUF748 domain-containing protein [Desulfobacter sp.]